MTEDDDFDLEEKATKVEQIIAAFELGSKLEDGGYMCKSLFPCSNDIAKSKVGSELHISALKLEIKCS